MREPGATVTPEAVLIEEDYAGVGPRMIAMLVDLLIHAGVWIVVAIALASGNVQTDAAVIVVLVVGFLQLWVYPMAFEAAWSGRTPGKRVAGIRVVRTDGQPVNGTAVVVRNLLRIVDLLPTSYAVGIVTMILTRKRQRVGDLAAGTVVVHEQRAALPQDLVLPPNPVRDRLAARLDVAGLRDRDYAAVRAFLRRRHDLSQATRIAIASDLQGRLTPIVGDPPEGVDAETFLEAVAHATRLRSSPAPGPGRGDDGSA